VLSTREVAFGSLIAKERRVNQQVQDSSTQASLIGRVVTAVSSDGRTGAIRSITFNGLGTIEFPTDRSGLEWDQQVESLLALFSVEAVGDGSHEHHWDADALIRAVKELREHA
jgi:hypothetical protein